MTCSACGGTEDLAVVQAGGDRSFQGALRILIFCASCRANSARCAEWREAVLLEEITEEVVLHWYREKQTISSPEIVSQIVFGEERTAFITEANKAMDESREGKIA